MLQHSPETLCVYLLSEMTASLPEGSSAWLQALRHHSLIAMVMRIADELTRVRRKRMRERGREGRERERGRERGREREL